MRSLIGRASVGRGARLPAHAMHGYAKVGGVRLREERLLAPPERLRASEQLAPVLLAEQRPSRPLPLLPHGFFNRSLPRENHSSPQSAMPQLAKVAASSLYAPAPSTTRGEATPLAATPKGDFLVYGAGKHVVIRSVADPLQATLYAQHQSAVRARRPRRPSARAETHPARVPCPARGR